MAFTGSEEHHITLSQAAEYTKNFRTKPVVPSVKGGYFGRNILEEILKQDGCVGIRCYYGQNDNNAPSLVLVGVDANGDDLTEGTLADIWVPCPPVCGKTNSLNGNQ